MKKLITILFICALANMTFAHRVLTIRNLSNEPKFFYALDMVYDTLMTGNLRSYAVILKDSLAIKLEPGEFITFSQEIPGNLEEFSFCPTPRSLYSIVNISKPNDSINPHPDLFWEVAKDSLKYVPTDCSQVLQLPNTLGEYLQFRGFKIAIKDPVSGYLRGFNYFIPNFYSSNHQYYLDFNSNDMYNIRETFLQLPLDNPTSEIHEVIFL